MNARWWLPPWGLRPAVAGPTIFETIRRVEELARERGNTKLANELYALGCDLGSPTEIPPFKLTPEHDVAAAEIARRRALPVAVLDRTDEVRKQRDNALARGDVAELGMRAAAAEAEAATKKLAELQAYVVELENRSVSDEAKAWKWQAEQDRANCLAMQQQLLDQRAANQVAELEHLWETDRAFVDPVGRAKVLGASS